MSARVKAAKAAKAVGAATAAALLLMATGACSGGDGGGNAGQAADASTRLPVTITGAGGSHVFLVERAVTAAQQAQGLMYRTDLTPDGGMLFHPYPAGGGAPREVEKAKTNATKNDAAEEATDRFAAALEAHVLAKQDVVTALEEYTAAIKVTATARRGSFAPVSLGRARFSFRSVSLPKETKP